MLAPWKLNCISLVEEAASASSAGGPSLLREAGESAGIGAPGGLAGESAGATCGTASRVAGSGAALSARSAFVGAVFAVWAARGVGELQNSTPHARSRKMHVASRPNVRLRL